MIPIFFNEPATRPTHQAEYDAWFQRCVAEHLPEIVATKSVTSDFFEQRGDERSWNVTVDFCHVFSECCESYYGSRTYASFPPRNGYYTFVGQLMLLLSGSFASPGHPEFTVGYDDNPIFRMELYADSLEEVSEIVRQTEKLLPDYRKFVTGKLPSLSVDVMNIDTGEEIKAY